MERLVTRIGSEPAVPTEFDMDFAFDLDKETFDKLQRIFNRLCDLTDILGDDYDLDRLKELVEADKEGRCQVIPCKEFFSMLGGDVYAIDDDEVLEVLLCGVGYDPDGIDFIDAVYAPGCEDEKGFTFRFSDVGKTIFLTREEAEAALEKMKEKDKQ